MSKTVEPPLPTTADQFVDPTAGISVDIAPQFRHHAAPHACTTTNLPVPGVSSLAVPGTEAVLGRRRPSSPHNRGAKPRMLRDTYADELRRCGVED